MAITITNKLSIRNFFSDFKPTNEDEREYAGEVLALYETARDMVLDEFDKNDVVFLDDILTGDEVMDDAMSILLTDLARVYPTGYSYYLGEFVGSLTAAMDMEMALFALLDLPTSSDGVVAV